MKKLPVFDFARRWLNINLRCNKREMLNKTGTGFSLIEMGDRDHECFFKVNFDDNRWYRFIW